MQHSNGKRWLLIGLLILGGFWLVNDSYDDGYRDALVQTGQAQNLRHYYDGPHFPWGLLILGGIGYVAWRRGVFDRFGGPGGPFNGDHLHERGIQRYGMGSGPTGTPGASASGQAGSPVFRGPRAFFDEWHRQAHEDAARAQYPAPPAPPAGAPGANQAASQGGIAPTPPPTPPAPEYWASMAGAAEAAGTSGAAGGVTAAPDGQQDERPNTDRAAGTAV